MSLLALGNVTSLFLPSFWVATIPHILDLTLSLSSAASIFVHVTISLILCMFLLWEMQMF